MSAQPAQAAMSSFPMADEETEPTVGLTCMEGGSVTKIPGRDQTQAPSRRAGKPELQPQQQVCPCLIGQEVVPGVSPHSAPSCPGSHGAQIWQGMRVRQADLQTPHSPTTEVLRGHSYQLTPTVLVTQQFSVWGPNHPVEQISSGALILPL